MLHDLPDDGPGTDAFGLHVIGVADQRGDDVHFRVDILDELGSGRIVDIRSRLGRARVRVDKTVLNRREMLMQLDLVAVPRGEIPVAGPDRDIDIPVKLARPAALAPATAEPP